MVVGSGIHWANEGWWIQQCQHIQLIQISFLPILKYSVRFLPLIPLHTIFAWIYFSITELLQFGCVVTVKSILSQPS